MHGTFGFVGPKGTERDLSHHYAKLVSTFFELVQSKKSLQTEKRGARQQREDSFRPFDSMSPITSDWSGD